MGEMLLDVLKSDLAPEEVEMESFGVVDEIGREELLGEQRHFGVGEVVDWLVELRLSAGLKKVGLILPNRQLQPPRIRLHVLNKLPQRLVHMPVINPKNLKLLIPNLPIGPLDVDIHLG